MTPQRRALFLIWLMMAVAYLDRTNITGAKLMTAALVLAAASLLWLQKTELSGGPSR